MSLIPLFFIYIPYSILVIALKSMSQYLASLILLVIVVVGLSIVNRFYTSQLSVFKKTSTNDTATYKVSLIDCINNTSYYYNYGQIIHLKTPVYVLSKNNTWIKSYTIPSKAVFRVQGCKTYLVLNTTNGQVVIKT